MATIIGSPPDVPTCTNLGDHGWCRNEITKTSFFVDDGTGHSYMDLNGKMFKAQLFHDPLLNIDYKWADLVAVSIVVPVYSFVKFKSWADNVCHQVNCDNGVGTWPDALGDLHNHLRMNFKNTAPHP